MLPADERGGQASRLGPQEATQLAAANYLAFGRSLFVQHVPDPAHRSHNDVHLAMASAGLLTFSIVSIGLYNVRYGPWNKGTWFGKVQAMADEMSRSMLPSDPLLLAFFPDILSDQAVRRTRTRRSRDVSFWPRCPTGRS